MTDESTETVKDQVGATVGERTDKRLSGGGSGGRSHDQAFGGNKMVVSPSFPFARSLTSLAEIT